MRGFFTPFIVTYAYICFSERSSTARAAPSTPIGMLPYRYTYPWASVPRLYPFIIHAAPLD